MKTGASFKRGSSKQNYQTPANFMQAVRSKFGEISFDLAAQSHNKQSEKFMSPEIDSLSQDWTKLSGLLWLNPPFDNITPWAEKCALSTGAKILFLVPASVGSNWFAKNIFGKATVNFLNGRMSFDGISPYPKDCILCVFGMTQPGFEVWTWNKH